MLSHLRKNQIKAIESSIDNDFESGIHFHATGSGKSWIAMTLISLFNEKYPKHNIMWICEKKSILIEQFNKNNIRERNFTNIIHKFNILNFSEFKLSDWFNSVNASVFWNKPVLLIINRAFLTSSDKYQKIKIPFHLIIHDECHSIVNETTRKFYDYMLTCKEIPRCIGFSATPTLEHNPYKKIISSYSIYDAFVDKVIVQPKIKWFTCDDILSQVEILLLIKNLINDKNIHYKKIIVWCGMIELCEKMAELWSEHFQDYLISIDTSKETKKYLKYEDFENADSKAILFCACKHREGSDIKNLDCCVFLDKVENRCPKVFVQCIGRVLRLDKSGNKKYGLIIDVKAKNSYTICNNINSYLNLPDNIFPWNFDYKTIKLEEKLVKINTLKMIIPKPKLIIEENEKDKDTDYYDNRYEIEDIKKLFIREIPDDEVYINRLNYELEMIYRKNLISHLIQAIDILKITNNIPHVTRGSCGSSLVCYLLGISHVDPVKNNIKFARFLTEYRNNLPDIDLDFPHNMRDEVFLKIELKWPGKVARISNHVYFHDKSAIRQAIRNAGIRKFIGKNDLIKEIAKLPKETQNFIIQEKKRLDNTFKCYSLHCGGIVYFPEGIPNDLLLQPEGKKTGILHQIHSNKIDISKKQNFKIDILSSRAISQLYEINGYKDINFEDYKYDKKTFDMLSRGDNIGLTLAESNLMRKAFIKIQPKNIHDIAVCLSIIRPAAKDANNVDEDEDIQDYIIFDDDAIDIISKEFKINDEESDKYRRGFAKGDKNTIDEFRGLICHLSKEKQREVMKKLANLSRYGFCKAHAFSYAQLVWKLAYMKAHNPKEFWKATLNNNESSYKKWVHIYEAKLAGVDINLNKLKKDDVSIYADNRRKKINYYSPTAQLKHYGYWTMLNDDFFPGCYLTIDNEGIYNFDGIIASVRYKNIIDKKNKNQKIKKLLLFIGVEKQKYIQVNIENIKYIDNKNIGIRGRGKPKTEQDKLFDVIEASEYSFY